MLLKVGLSELVLLKYCTIFMEDDWKSFPAQVEALGYLTDRLDIQDEEELCKLLYRNTQLLRQSREELAAKIDVFLELLPEATIEDCRQAFFHRRKMWTKTANDLRSLLRILREEFHLSDQDLSDWFARGKSRSVFSEQLLLDLAERKLIFEEVYGPDCFRTKKSLRALLLECPYILALPVSDFAATVRQLRRIFACPGPGQLGWLPPNLLTYKNLDRLERRVAVWLAYLTDTPLPPPPPATSSLDGAEDEGLATDQRASARERQKLLEERYPMDALRKGASPAVGGAGPAAVDEEEEGGEAARTDQENPEEGEESSGEEVRVFEDYRRVREASRLGHGHGQVGEGNAYEQLVRETLQKFREQRQLEILQDLAGYGQWLAALEQQLAGAGLGLGLVDLYRELWRQSEGCRMPPDEALQAIRVSVRGDVRQSMSKLGLLTVFLGLTREEAGRVQWLTRGLLGYSLEERVIPRLVMVAAVLHREQQRRGLPSALSLPQEEETADRSRAELLTKSALLYREHPFRRELREFFLRDPVAFLTLAGSRWQRGLEAWEALPEADRPEDVATAIYRLVTRQPSTKPKPKPKRAGSPSAE